MIFENLNYIFFSLFFALIIESPLIYSRIKNKKYWVPINSPPWMLGDDYYYFSVLNEYHKRILKIKLKTFTSPLSYQTLTQSFGHLLNLIPYHFGYLLEDKRLGVLMVKITNRILLFFSVIFFSQQIFIFLEYNLDDAKLLGIFLIYFFLYPGPISFLSIRSGMLFNIFNSKHIFNSAHVNDLTRGMHSELTAPLLIFLTGMLLFILNHYPDYLYLYIFSSSIILFFQYFPVFVCYSFFCIIILIFEKQFFFTFLQLIIFFSLSLLYLKILSKCKVASELIAHDDGGKKFKFGIRLLAEIIAVGFFNILLKFYFDNDIVFLLSFSFSFSVITHLLFKHQLSRFWTRGGMIIFQLLLVIALVEFLTNFDENILFILIAFISIGFLIYFYKNSKYLYAAGSTKIPKEFNEDIISKIFDKKFNGINCVTDSVELSYYINLYTNSNSILKNYTIQSFGYQKHLRDICYNYKAIDHDLDKVIHLLTASDSRWRSLDSREFITEDYPYFHEIQYIVSNYLFNQKIIDDGMYINKTWTNKFKKLIKDVYISINKNDFNELKIVKKSKKWIAL